MLEVKSNGDPLKTTANLDDSIPENGVFKMISADFFSGIQIK